MPNTYACKGVFNPIFPPNSAEGLHFSAFHYTCNILYTCTLLTIVTLTTSTTGRLAARASTSL